MPPPNFDIKSQESVSEVFREIGIKDFQSACLYIQKLPYNRTSVKSNLLLVISENCGTCSSKHAILKKLAEENNIHDFELKIGIYKMTPKNTPGIQTIFPEHIPFIPEAHSYLVAHGIRLDYTREGSQALDDTDILKEISISADEMASKKELFHKDYLLQWCADNNLDFQELWELRESSIAELSI